MPSEPVAYHITFGTYGTRLHGDTRGTVDRRHNTPGEPVLGRRDSWQRVEEARLRHPPVLLTLQQRLYAQRAIADVCERGGWQLHITACQSDHVHVLLSAEQDGAAVRRWLKTWLGLALSERWPPPRGRSWWAEGGSVKWLWDERSVERVFQYIEAQRAGE